MKRWLDRTWAKLAAYFLTLLLGILTVLGGVGTAVLISYDVFLDGGAWARQSLYQEQCYDDINHADSFVRVNLANAGLLSDADGYDYSGTIDFAAESEQQLAKRLPREFAAEFSRESFSSHITVADGDTGDVYMENFPLTDSDTPLYTAQSTCTYAAADGSVFSLTYTADLLQSDNAPSYSFLLLSWLPDHAGLTVFLTVLFLLLGLFCFSFLMASSGHWQGYDGIHLTWLDKIPADVFLLVLVCAFFSGWYGFYYEWGRILFCAALIPFVLLFLCAFAAQCKAGTVLRGALIARACRLVWRVIQTVFRSLYRIAAGLPLVWKTGLVGLALVLAEFFLFEQSRNYSDTAALFLMLKALELLAVLGIALNLRTLQKGGERLSQGDFSTPINTKHLIGDFRRFGQELNAVQGGLEQALQEKMRSERMKTELITNVSHDIKTPLTSIVNYVDLLQKVDVQPETAREYIAVLDRQSRRLKKLTEDLVEASKASSGALPVDLQPTDVTVLFDQIIGEYQDRLADCHLTLVARPPEQPLTVRADGKLLSRVMDNLVSNICKYALEDTRVYAVASFDDDSVTLSFKNVSRAELNISPDELMERFVRGDTSRHTEGSGLGLSIAGSLVHLMGGTFALSIDGDLFRADITLPRVR